MRGAKVLRALVPALAAIAVLALAATAQADYEQVGLFGQSGNAEQLNLSTGVAINTTGAGGVEPGSLYVSAGNQVSRYNAKGEIEEVWGWNVIVSGPDKSPTGGFERCRPANGDICARPDRPRHGEGVGYFFQTHDVAVDQSTGYVYVLNQVEHSLHEREHNLIEVFSADGSEVIARFGDAPAEGETVETAPEKVPQTGSIVVDEDGTVYLGAIGSNSYPSRVMCFQPENGNFEHYAYCGRSQDIEAEEPHRLALDDAGHLYVANQEFIQEFSSAASTATLCTYVTHGQLYAMTVNPITGEVFYYNLTDSTIHRLKPCNPAKGKFEEAQARVKISPVGPVIRGLAFNSALSWGPNRPPGVLYGAADGNFESSGVHYNGLGYIFAPAEVRSPAVLSESVSNTRTASTVLRAEIDPNGFGTHYIFQYLTAAQYEADSPSERFSGATEAPIGGGEIGGGSIGEAETSIIGLTPDTAYRFRVVATSECNGGGGEPCTGEGETFSFSTYPLFPPGLPDHRAYEMVSPAQKHGAEVLPAEPYISSCFNLFVGFAEECKPRANVRPFPMQSSPDGEALAYEGQPFNPFEGAVNYDSYVSRRTTSGWQTTALIPAQPPSGVTQFAFDAGLDEGLLGSPSVGSERASLVLQPTSQPGSLTPLLSEEPPNRTSGSNSLVVTYGGHSADFSRIFFTANDSLTEETPFAPEPPDPGASKSDLYEWHEGQLAVVSVVPGNNTVFAGASYASISPDTNAISEDGARVYFTDEAGNLYLREQGEVTRQINDPGHFLSASPDGSEVLLSDGCLYSLESESCTDLTEGKGGFKGLVGQSKDLSHIYFVDSAVVAENEGASLDSKGNSQFAEAGKNNLYSWSGGEARFVAQLAANDDIDNGTTGPLADWSPNPSHRSAEASPNGRFVAFASVLSLTGHDNVGLCGLNLNPKREYEHTPAPCPEAFLYDSATGKLVCASCNPTGEAPLGNTTLRLIEGGENLPQPRYLTDEGRLYFDSQDSLVARDTNEGVEDVYEYSPQGAGAEGTCEREAGCTRLISAGTEPVDSNLIAVDETGKNVFFDTRDKLALKDKDELLDVYDAREGGGIAAESEISRAECQGENCQAPVSPPNDPTPSSSTFEGAGNVKETPVAKKHTKKHKHAKKHKKKAKKNSRTAKRNHGGAK
jgi:hypothetical protein